MKLLRYGQHVFVLPVNGNCNDCKGGHVCRHTGKCLHKPENKLINDLLLYERAFMLPHRETSPPVCCYKYKRPIRNVRKRIKIFTFSYVFTQTCSYKCKW